MTRFAAALTAAPTPALIPTVTLGAPNLAECAQLMADLAAAGAPALDLHLPFSDPCADSVALQQASHRALSAGLKIEAALKLSADFNQAHPNVALMLSLYVNNALAYGLERFLQQAAAAGVSALLLTDVSHAMLAPEHGPFNFKALSAKYGLELVLLAPDNQSPAALQAICADSAACFVQPVHGGAACAAALTLARSNHTPSILPLKDGTAAELNALQPLLAQCRALTTGDLVAHCQERGTSVVAAYTALRAALSANYTRQAA